MSFREFDGEEKNFGALELQNVNVDNDKDIRDICSCAGNDVDRGEGSVVINVPDEVVDGNDNDDNNNKGDNDGGGSDNDPNDDKETDEEDEDDEDDDKNDTDDPVDFDANNECDEDSAACLLLYFKEVVVKVSFNQRREVALK